MYQAIIFDLDGTLVSVKKEYRQWLVPLVLKELGKEAAPENEIDEFWFMHSRERIIRRWGLEPPQFWPAYRKHDSIELRRASTFVFDDIDVLQTLKERGVRLAIFSSTRQEMATMELAMLPDIFDAVVIAPPMGTVPMKPQPDGALECLRLLATSKKDTIYVGNSDEDILTARNTGLYSVLIDRKEHPHTLNPDRVITSLRELL